MGWTHFVQKKSYFIPFFMCKSHSKDVNWQDYVCNVEDKKRQINIFINFLDTFIWQNEVISLIFTDNKYIMCSMEHGSNFMSMRWKMIVQRRTWRVILNERWFTMEMYTLFILKKQPNNGEKKEKKNGFRYFKKFSLANILIVPITIICNTNVT